MSTDNPTTDGEETFEYGSIEEFKQAAEDGDLPSEVYRELATVDQLVDEAFARKRELYDQTIEVTHTQSAARVRMNINRGTGVRDQDEVTGEVKVRTPGELVTEIPVFTTMLTQQMEELRRFQPDDEGDD